MIKPWHLRKPQLIEQIKTDLQKHYPTLHLSVDGEFAEVRGTFPIKSPNGRVLDRWAISIELPPGFPKDLPVVRELQKRIPWTVDSHVESDGKACVLLPDERFRIFPEGAPFLDFLNGPVLSFFLGQSLRALGEEWPFGEWGHGANGIFEFYKELIGTDDKQVLISYLKVLSKQSFKGHWDCPCGSGKKMRKCHRTEISNLRHKIFPDVARRTLEHLVQIPKRHP
jgi:hypothetical protein